MFQVSPSSSQFALSRRAGLAKGRKGTNSGGYRSAEIRESPARSGFRRAKPLAIGGRAETPARGASRDRRRPGSPRSLPGRNLSRHLPRGGRAGPVSRPPCCCLRISRLICAGPVSDEWRIEPQRTTGLRWVWRASRVIRRVQRML